MLQGILHRGEESPLSGNIYHDALRKVDPGCVPRLYGELIN